MARPAHNLWTLEEFLAFDDGSDTRYELVRGQIVAMTQPGRMARWSSGWPDRSAMVCVRHMRPESLLVSCRQTTPAATRPTSW